MWSWSTNVTDGRTDRQTDRQHAISMPRYALVHRAVKINTCIHQYTGGQSGRRDQDQNDESALKVGPNHQCLQPHMHQILLIWTAQSDEGTPSHTRAAVVIVDISDRAFPVAAVGLWLCGTVFHRMSLLRPLSPSSAVIINHISSHFLIPLSDSSLISSVIHHFWHHNRYYILTSTDHRKNSYF